METHPERITKDNKSIINDLDYEGIKFPVSKKDYCKVEGQNNICINVFCCENGLTYSVYVSDQKFHNFMDLLWISNGNKSHYVYTKYFNRFMFNKTKNKNEKHFCKCCLQCFSSEKVLIEHKENCLIINRKQSVKLKSGSISFKNYFKQLPVSFEIYANFEFILKKVESCNKNNGSYTEKYQDHVLCSFAYKVFLLIINLAKKLFCTEKQMLLIPLLKQLLVSMIILTK